MRWRFIHSDNLASELIDFYEGERQPTHVDAVFENGYFGARASKIGDVPAGVQLRPFNYEKPTWEVFVDLEGTAEQETKWKDALLSKEGQPYDFVDVFNFALPFNLRHRYNKMFCSSLQIWALMQSGRIPPKLTRPYWKIDPAQLLLILSSHVSVTVPNVIDAQ